MQGVQFVLHLPDLCPHAGRGVLFGLGPEQGGFADDAVIEELLEARPSGADVPLELRELCPQQLVEMAAEPGHVPRLLLLLLLLFLLLLLLLLSLLSFLSLLSLLSLSLVSCYPPLLDIRCGLLGHRHRQLQLVVYVYEELVEAAPRTAHLAAAAAAAAAARR